MHRIDNSTKAASRLVRLSTAFDRDEEGTDLEVTIPEDLSEMSDEELTAARETAREAFEAIFGDGEVDYTHEDLDQMEALTEAIHRVDGEITERGEVAAQRSARAAELASSVAGTDADDDGDDDGDDDAVDDAVDDDAADAVAEAEAIAAEAAAEEKEAVTAATTSPKSKNVNIKVRSNRRRNPVDEEPRSDDVLTFTGTGGGKRDGQRLDSRSLAQQVLDRIGGVNFGAIESADRAGRTFQSRMGVASLDRTAVPGFDHSLVIKDTDSLEEADRVISHAVDQHRLPGGALTAGTGWCSVSELVNDVFDAGVAPGEGLLSTPEVVMPSGGIRFEQDLSFPAILADDSGWTTFTEAQAEADDFQASGSPPTDKPTVEITCGTPQEVRLKAAALQITGDVLMRRTRPQRIARFVELSLAAHLRRLSDLKIAAIEAGSTAVSAPGTQVGATASLLSFIELQVQFSRERYNRSSTATMEALLPFWVKGVIRHDLSRRLGVDMIDVPDSRIEAWFRSRGIVPQYVYGWQPVGDIATPTMPTEWPSTVKVVVYPAGTWVSGTLDVINIDTMFDSTLLRQNRYTALFVEEGWTVFNRGAESVVATVDFDADGATHAGIDIAHDGTEVPAA